MTQNESQIQCESVEAVHQLFRVKWRRYLLPNGKAPLYAVPNEGKRSGRNGARMKAQGLSAGVPDLVLAVPRGQYGGMYIEMKTKSGKLTDSQRMWCEYLYTFYCVRICRSVESVIEEVTEYMEG
jgi:hypothetical protein